MGSGDRVSCFYCGGRLFHWKLRDNPWYEHTKWFLLWEFVLKKQGVKYVEKVCQIHPGLHRPNIENPIRSAATNQLRTMLTNQTQSTVAAEERSQRLEAMMLLDPHVKYAKSIGIENTKIRYALLQQMEKNNCNFSNCQELLNLILDIKKEDKCMKRKKQGKKTQFACLVDTLYFAGPVYKTSILVGCALKTCPKQSASNNGNCTRA